MADVVSDQVAGLADEDPDVVLISVGANDVVHLTSRAAFRSGYEDLMAALPGGALVVLLGVPDMGAPPRYLQPLRGIAAARGRQLEAVARTSRATTAPSTSTSRGRRARPCGRPPTGTSPRDRYHPSDAGYALWADAVLEQLRPALAEQEAS